MMMNKKAGRWILGENNNLFYEQFGTSRAIGSEDKVGELSHDFSFWKFVFTYIQRCVICMTNCSKLKLKKS